MKKIYTLLLLLLVGSFAFGQGHEKFTNIPTNNAGSYNSRSWTGDDGSQWSAENARTDQTITGEAITVRREGGFVQSGTISNGVGEITVTTRRDYSGGSGNLTVFINGSAVGTIPYSDSIQTTTISDVNVSGDIVIRFETLSNNDRVTIDDVIWTAFAAGPTCTAPSTQATLYTTTAISSDSATLGWTRGTDGDNVLVLMKAATAVDTDPVNGTDYLTNDELGTGNFVVYKGPGTSVDLTGLNENTTYHVAVYEYNNTDFCYNLTALTGDFTTLCATPTEASAFIAASGISTANLSWTNGSCYDDILVLAKEGSAITATPTGDGTTYTADANFGTGTDLGTNEYAVYKGTGTGLTVTGLTNGATYHFTVFTRKGNSWSAGIATSVTVAPDATTEIYEPTTLSQIPGTTFTAANMTTSETAQDVFGFIIEDQGSGDGLPTNVTRMRFVPDPNNTADWTDHIQGITLRDENATEYFPSSTNITDTEIILDFEPSIDIADNTALEFVLGIYLHSSPIVDGSVIQLQIDASSHGFEANTSGSTFADSFSLDDVVGSEFIINVDSDQLAFSQQPTHTFVDEVMNPAVIVSAVDANGNLDTSYNLDVMLLSLIHI